MEDGRDNEDKTLPHILPVKLLTMMVAKCFDDGRDIAEEIVKAGLALDIPHFPNADYDVLNHL